MTNGEKKDLCLKLLYADTEDEIVHNLEEHGYWNDLNAWRLYGDRNGNFATIGNQQSRPEAALVEKIVNSVDARLMNECLSQKIDPISAIAPQSIREAVAAFFEQGESSVEVGGTLQRWASGRRTQESKNITLAVTGHRRNPCLTLVDTGEGQTPHMMPATFLSIDRDNKLRIPFVQGKFNMGGTGVLKFCGKHSFQLIITRRNPAIVRALNESDPRANEWGFTIIRRERPTQTAGAVRNSVYTYLAPVDASTRPRKGDVLSFQADELQLMPELNEPYVRSIQSGSAVKLYNYDMKGFTSHILMKDGLLYRLEILLPEIALPVSLHECRDFIGKKAASFVTPLSGLTVRLEEGRGGNLETGFPCSVPFSVNGEKMVAKIYAFKKGRAETYRTNEGIIFTINGQTHGAVPKTIFQRNAVKMGRLADSLLVTIDCSTISVDAREDLFMNSRDRLSSGVLRKAVERQLEEILHKHPGLRQLRDERRSQEIAERLEDSKPLEDVLQSILKSSPSLASLFLQGHRLSQPHRRKSGGNGNGRGNENGDHPFVGKPHPTYFRFKNKQDGEMLERACEVGRRCRLTFETDVENDYFSRAAMPGRYDVEVVEGHEDVGLNHSLTLHDGLAHWSVEMPDDVIVGERITLQCMVTDEVIGDGFINVAKLVLSPKSDPPSGGESRKKHKKSGDMSGNDEPGGLQTPHIEKVRESEWKQHKFDKHSACNVVQDEIGEEGSEQTEYTFYINVDNICLRTDMKNGRGDPKLVEAKFVYGNVLISLALIHDHNEQQKQRANLENGTAQNDEMPVEDHIMHTTRAIAPFMVPMIDYLGALTSEEVSSLGEIGDDE